MLGVCPVGGGFPASCRVEMYADVRVQQKLQSNTGGTGSSPCGGRSKVSSSIEPKVRSRKPGGQPLSALVGAPFRGSRTTTTSNSVSGRPAGISREITPSFPDRSHTRMVCIVHLSYGRFIDILQDCRLATYPTPGGSPSVRTRCSCKLFAPPQHLAERHRRERAEGGFARQYSLKNGPITAMMPSSSR
jgi:hypothetical protein